MTSFTKTAKSTSSFTKTGKNLEVVVMLLQDGSTFLLQDGSTLIFEQREEWTKTAKS